MNKLLLIALLTLTAPAIASQENYQLGLQHGCGTGKADAGSWGFERNKDIELYLNDKYYKVGWDDGYRQCKAESDAVFRAIDNSIRW